MYLENELDKFLKIKTSGRDASNSNYLNFPYEATPYSVLQELANSGHITKKDIVICGHSKGANISMDVLLTAEEETFDKISLENL